MVGTRHASPSTLRCKPPIGMVFEDGDSPLTSGGDIIREVCGILVGVVQTQERRDDDV